MTQPLVIYAVGTPAPQGSKKAFVVGGHARVVDDSKKTKPWRQDVTAAAYAAIQDRPDALTALSTGPLHVTIVFFLARPKAHYGTGRNAAVLKATAPTYVDKKPDVDKLVRSTLDALTDAGVYRDDNQVARLWVEKQYADHATGAQIMIRPLASVGDVPGGAR
ncbi:RusA family crossover junction endodeoxyribonuclease [Nocardioides zeae]